MNPSNQPEPDSKGIESERLKPDAEGEVGLRDKVDDLMCRRRLFSDIDRDIHREILDKLMALFQTDKAAAVVEAITRIYTVKTEGLFDDGDLFIKRAPVDQEIINMLGYETFKAIQEAADDRLQPPTAGEETIK